MVIDRDQDTICAVATPYGRGGISVIRVSGKRALDITKALCAFVPNKCESHRIYYGWLKDPSRNEDIDEVMAAYFQEGRSFTGEETVEISCHGSPVICEKILQALVEQGARMADRGEFTYRAFINGRIDLVQAESVLSLIESRTKESSRVALQQLKGDLSGNLENLESELTWCLAHIEAGIDFSTEGLDVVEPEVLNSKLNYVLDQVNSLVLSYKYGRLLKDGVRAVLVGRPNVGKSSLMNLLVEEQRAIVTEIPGTTRDVVSSETNYKNYRFNFLDTAGLREDVSDQVEKIGVERTKSAMDLADFLLFVIEAPRPLSVDEKDIFSKLDLSRTFVVFNKTDLLRPNEGVSFQALAECNNFKELANIDEFLNSQVLSVSTFDKKSRELILEKMLRKIGYKENEDPVLLIQARHFECLNQTARLIEQSLSELATGAGAEFVSLNLKQALIYIQEILGKRFDDQVMDRVFKEFCIGK